jgi:hypothetical protein
MPPPPPTPVHRNESVEMLMNWKDSGTSMKSDAEVNRLVKDVLLDSNFKLEDLQGFNVARENQRSDAAEKKSPFFDSFQTADIDIEVPSGIKGIPPGTFSVPGLLYRKLTAVIHAAFSSPLASHFHFSPFKLFHRSPSGEEERIFSEVYNSDAFIEEHDNVQRAPLPPDQQDCKLEKVLAALMVWSDGTHLTNFGTAKLWPVYFFFGNASKYISGQPNSGACQHVAYIPSLPDSFQDFAASFCSKWSTQKKALMTHCRRELMHGIWKFLLDADFVHAYKYGMVVKCADGIERRVYPRFFTYSADYPEKYVDSILSWTVELTLLSEFCLPPYETKAFALALGVSFRNQNLTRLARSVTVNFDFKMFVHTCLIMFESLGTQSTTLQRRSLVLLSTGFSGQLPLFRHWYVKFPVNIYLTFMLYS